jgi:hypothetical protein
MDLPNPPNGGHSRMNRGAAADLICRSKLTPQAKLIALAYLSHQSSAEDPREATSWPGLSTLAEWASASRSTTQAHRAELRRAGCLLVVEVREDSLRCRLDLEAIERYTPPPVEPKPRKAKPEPEEPDTYTGSRQGVYREPVYREPAGGIPGAGIPIPGAGIGGAGSRHRGIPGAGTEPSSDISPQLPLLKLSLEPSTDCVEGDPPPRLPPLPGWAQQVKLPQGVSRRDLVGVVLRTVARVSLRPLAPEWCSLDWDARRHHGRIVDPEAKTDATQVLALWTGLGKPDLAQFEADAEKVASAFHHSKDPIFARNVRAEGWKEGTDRSRSIATFCVLRSWEERLRVATFDYCPFI